MSTTPHNGNGGGNGVTEEPPKQVKTKGVKGSPIHRFKPGQSGNPAGRPRRSEAFGKTIRDWLDKKDAEGKVRIMALIQRLYKDDPKTLLAYGFGKPAEMVEVTQAEGAPFEFVVRLNPEELP